MRGKQKLKNNTRGITLVALVVTIIVLIILAGVSITAVLNQNGVIIQSKEAKEKTLNAEVHEQEQMNEVAEYIQNNKDDENNNHKESYIGYYADVNADGIVDGIIFADLAIGGSGTYGDNNETFSYEAITGTKEYYISQTNYEGSFGTKDVLTATGEGKDRFYVMSLTDVTSTETSSNKYFSWYAAAEESGISNYDTVTPEKFGSGKTNTETMIEKWNNSIYGAQNVGDRGLDVWGAIQDKANKGWFVPAKGEWTAFAYNLGISTGNYTKLGLGTSYWSSTLCDPSSVWVPYFPISWLYAQRSDEPWRGSTFSYNLLKHKIMSTESFI